MKRAVLLIICAAVAAAACAQTRLYEKVSKPAVTDVKATIFPPNQAYNAIEIVVSNPHKQQVTGEVVCKFVARGGGGFVTAGVKVLRKKMTLAGRSDESFTYRVPYLDRQSKVDRSGCTFFVDSE